jgi:hypothetical protein
MSRNLNEATSKDTLAQWVSLLLEKALTEDNIKKDFIAMGIWPLNDHAVDSMLAASKSFQSSTWRVGALHNTIAMQGVSCLRRASRTSQAMTAARKTKTTTTMTRTRLTQGLSTFTNRQHMEETMMIRMMTVNISFGARMKMQWNNHREGPEMRMERTVVDTS